MPRPLVSARHAIPRAGRPRPFTRVLPSPSPRALAALAVLIATVASPVTADAAQAPPRPSATSAEVEALRAELERLRSESAAAIRALEGAIEDLQSQAAAREASPPSAPARPRANPGRSSSATDLNPAISVIGDFILEASDDDDARDIDYTLSEIELGFQAAVDPYVRFDVFAAFGEHGDAELLYALEDEHDHEEEEGGFEAELEEAYVTTLGLPAGLQVRAGRMRLPFGRHNLVHLPEDSWADQPTANELFLGPHQLIDEAIELSWLAPTPFFWKLTGAVGRGPGESPTFTRSSDDDFLHLLRNEISWDPSPSSTLLFGQSWARGPGEESGRIDSEIWGADVTWKWIPSSRRSFTWQTEAFWRDVVVGAHGHEEEEHEDEHEEEGHDDDHDELDLSLASDFGAYTWLEWQFAKRWRVGARFDIVDYDEGVLERLGMPSVDDRRDLSLVLAFWPSEFQTLRFQAKRTWDDLLADEVDSFFVNWTWVIGAHGAHSF